MELKDRTLRFDRFSTAWKFFAVTLVSASVSVLLYANSRRQTILPGAMPFVPTRIDWLTTTLQASLRDEELQSNGYDLEITSPNPETVLIYVVYTPAVNRAVMNISIDAARKVIQITANSYGWGKWVKIREDVEPARDNETK